MNATAAAQAEQNTTDADEAAAWHILLADDHAMVREALSHMLERLDPGLHMHQARNVEEAKALLADGTSFAMLLLDYNMPGMAGADTIREIKGDHPDLPVGVISGYVSSEDVEPLIKAGAIGVFPKTLSAPSLIMTLKLALSGQVYVPWSGDLAKPAERPAIDMPDLSDRQTEVLRHVVTGAPNKEIARRLGLSEVTVKIHVAAICRKFAVANRTQLATAALQAGVKPAAA